MNYKHTKIVLVVLFYCLQHMTCSGQKKFNVEELLLSQKRALNNRDTLTFLSVYKKLHTLAIKTKDSILFKKVYSYKGRYFFNKYNMDSAYYYFYRSNDYAKDSLFIGKNYLKMAIAQKNGRDFLGSIASSLEAVEFLKNTRGKRYLASSFNNLGILCNELKQFEESLKYHKKSLEIRKQLENNFLILSSLNNIAFVYSHKKDYTSAIHLLDSIIELTNVDTKLSLRTKIIDNLGYTYLLSNQKQKSLPYLQKAYVLRKQSNDFWDMSTSELHLTEYYYQLGNFEKSKEYALKAKKTSSRVVNLLDVIESLKWLVKLGNSNEANSFELLNLMDSLRLSEQKNSNQFALIRYRVKEKESQNNFLKAQNLKQKIKANKQETYLVYTFLGFIVVSILAMSTYAHFNNSIRIKTIESNHRESLLENEIRELLIQQQNIITTSKIEERKRIASNLHDSVAGKLSGVRLQLDVMAEQFSLEQRNTIDGITEFVREIITETRLIAHNLTNESLQEEPFLFIIRRIIDRLLPEEKYVRIFQVDSINWEMIPYAIKFNFYYIIIEACQNIIKHANATEVAFQFQLIEDQVSLNIQDNGTGFSKKQHKGIGIKNMKHRAVSLDGNFTILSDTKGTALKVTIPLKQYG